MDIRRIHSEGLRVVVVGQVEDSFFFIEVRALCSSLLHLFIAMIRGIRVVCTASWHALDA